MIDDANIELDDDGPQSDFVHEWLAHEQGFISDEIDDIEAELLADRGDE